LITAYGDGGESQAQGRSIQRKGFVLGVGEMFFPFVAVVAIIAVVAVVTLVTLVTLISVVSFVSPVSLVADSAGEFDGAIASPLSRAR